MKAIELEKAYDPKTFEKRIYSLWKEQGMFKPEVAKSEAQDNSKSGASFYDIREFFQRRSEKGTMNQKSNDETYNALIKDLRQNLSVLAEKIKPKVYEYGFLLE
jgi:hypothetical protein